MGMTDRDPNAAELARMVELSRKGMIDGGVGLSSGLYYAPGSYSKTAEVIAMAKATAPYGGVYSSHIRDEADYTIGVVAAVQEVIDIAEQGGVIGVVSHMKALGPASWGLSKTLIEQHRRGAHARRAGVCRSVSVRSERHRHRRRADAAIGAGRRPRRDDEAHHRRAAQRDPRAGQDQHRAPRRRRHADDQPLLGRIRRSKASGSRTLAAKAGVAPEEYALQLLEKGDASLVSFNMSEGDIEGIMRQPWTMTCTDGDLVPHGRGRAASARLWRVRAKAEALRRASATRSTSPPRSDR